VGVASLPPCPPSLLGWSGGRVVGCPPSLPTYSPRHIVGVWYCSGFISVLGINPFLSNNPFMSMQRSAVVGLLCGGLLSVCGLLCGLL